MQISPTIPIGDKFLFASIMSIFTLSIGFPIGTADSLSLKFIS